MVIRTPEDIDFSTFPESDGRMERLPGLPRGGIESPLLGTELRPMAMARIEWRPAGVWLRVIDPRTGEPIPIAEEEHVAFRATREQLTTTREQLTTTREQLTTTREQLDMKELARLAAEERAVRVETELRLLRDELARRQDSDFTS